MTPEQKLAIARQIVARDAPYIASILYALVPHFDKSIKTMATTEHMVLIVNPEWILTLTNEVLAGVLMHECSHVFRDHISRFSKVLNGPEKALANAAMDMAINPSLIDAGWQLTKDALMPEQHRLPRNKPAEWYFAELRKQKQPNMPAPGQADKSQGKGQGGADDGDGQGETEQEESGGGNSKEPGVCSGCCGGMSGNSGGKQAKEEHLNKEMGRGETERELLVKITADAIKKHAQEGRGRLPSGFAEAAKQYDEPPKIDWKSHLGRVIRRATGKIKSGGRDFSLKRPSKRSYTRGILRPGLVQQMPEIAIIRDTSGSMGAEEIKTATIESMGIIKAAGVDSIWFLDADAEVSFKKRIRLSELRELPVHGRGGTSFIPAIEALDKLKPRPDIAIYITDGDGYAPKHPPRGMEFIWCVVPSYYKRRPANWGHLVVVSESNIELGDPHE